MRTAPPHLSGFRLYFNSGSVPFWAVHVAALVGVVVLGFSWSGLLLAAGLYYVRMFFLTAGYHRYFAHRSFSTSRWFQVLLAVMGQTCAQMGALWWASNHRAHHRHSDQEADVHSALQRGFWWSHIGWFMDGQHEGTDFSRVRDLAKYPELVWLNQRSVALLPAVALALSIWGIAGIHGLVWGFFVSTVLLWHGTFTINSLAHLFGRRRYATRDESRNNGLLALITMGEGWHNNHHHYQSCARQGFFWWEIDPTYYLLRLLARLGLIWDLREPPKAVVHSKLAPKRGQYAQRAEAARILPGHASAEAVRGDVAPTTSPTATAATMASVSPRTTTTRGPSSTGPGIATLVINACVATPGAVRARR